MDVKDDRFTVLLKSGEELPCMTVDLFREDKLILRKSSEVEGYHPDKFPQYSVSEIVDIMPFHPLHFSHKPDHELYRDLCILINKGLNVSMRFTSTEDKAKFTKGIRYTHPFSPPPEKRTA